jgi:23S rRNA (uridine2552-2'-O)-methyltransferase
MSGKGKSRRWYKAHRADPYVKRSTAEGLRSRAAYKLMQLDARERLFRPGQWVVDLGAAPGGWSQVAAPRVAPGGRVLALDRLEMVPIEGVCFFQGDFFSEALRGRLIAKLPGSMADIVISDMAPNLTGVKIADQAACEELVLDVMEYAGQVLKPGGTLLTKVFHGAGMDGVLATARQRFEQVRLRKPDASRARSAESYLLAVRRSS